MVRRADFLARTETYDAVLLDLGLPGVDGLTLLRRWREAGLDVPVLVLTARGSWSETRARHRQRGRRLPAEAVPHRGGARARPGADSSRRTGTRSPSFGAAT